MYETSQDSNYKLEGNTLQNSEGKYAVTSRVQPQENAYEPSEVSNYKIEGKQVGEWCRKNVSKRVQMQENPYKTFRSARKYFANEENRKKLEKTAIIK